MGDLMAGVGWTMGQELVTWMGQSRSYLPWEV